MSFPLVTVGQNKQLPALEGTCMRAQAQRPPEWGATPPGWGPVGREVSSQDLSGRADGTSRKERWPSSSASGPGRRAGLAHLSHNIQLGNVN